MRSVNTDEKGVPILSAGAIELKTEEVISFFDKEILNEPQPTPLRDFVEGFHTRFNVERSYSESLGVTKYGNAILGKTQLKPLGLYGDVSLADDPRFNFVLAHELGHVVLHRSVNVKKAGYEEQEIVDTKIDFVTGKKNLRTSRDWLEWQANRFASAILMPRLSIMLTVLQKQKEMDIKRNLGRIVLEPKEYSVRDYKEIQNHLELVFSVNATNVECRLKDLGILIDRMNLDVQHISELFASE